jgi:hypothetical protein
MELILNKKKKGMCLRFRKKISPKTSGPHCAVNIITAAFSLTNKQTNKQTKNKQTKYISSHVPIIERKTTVWGHRSLQNCGSSGWNLLYVTLLAPRILMWRLDFWKKLRDPNNGTLIWMLQIFTNSAEQGITKLENPRIKILRTNAIREKTCL